MTGVAPATLAAPLATLPLHLAVLVAAALAAVLRRRAAFAVAGAATAGVAVWSATVPAVTLPYRFIGFEAAILAVDPASRLMGVIFGGIGFGAVAYAHGQGMPRRQLAVALSYVGASLGAVFAGDWLTLVFFWELMAVTSTVLVWQHGGEAVPAGYRYALLHGVGGGLLLVAAVWQQAAAGTLLLRGGIAAGGPAALAALGMGVNVGFVGLHAWLPDTYPRPHVAASVFLCVYTTKTGVYGLYRAFPDGNLAVAYMGGAMALVGVTYAVLQDDVRRLLSYHIQSQVGYMVAGIGLGGALATAGGFAHVFNHILYKALLFMVAGVVIARTGRERLSRLGGLRHEMPFAFAVFVVAALSIAGFPGFNGFVSKGIVTAAAHDVHRDGLWLALLAAGVGTFLSFAKMGWKAFLGPPRDLATGETGRAARGAMVAVAALCVGLGLHPDPLLGALPGSAADAHPFTLVHVGEGLLLAGLGVGGYLGLRSWLANVGGVPDVDAVYRPVFARTGRWTIVALTDVGTGIEGAVVAVGAALRRVHADPERFARRYGVLPEETERGRGRPLRAGIGDGVLLVAAVVSIGLAVLLLAT